MHRSRLSFFSSLPLSADSRRRPKENQPRCHRCCAAMRSFSRLSFFRACLLSHHGHCLSPPPLSPLSLSFFLSPVLLRNPARDSVGTCSTADANGTPVSRALASLREEIFACLHRPTLVRPNLGTIVVRVQCTHLSPLLQLLCRGPSAIALRGKGHHKALHSRRT